MASLVLGFAGSAIGGAMGGPLGAKIGGFIGSTLGGMIDNQLFPTKTEGPRLDDLSVQSSAYGAILPLVYGPKNRLAGQVIWSTGLIEHSKTTQQGGKGGPAVQQKEYTYTSSFAVAIAGRKLSAVNRIMANNKAIFDVDAPVTDSMLCTAIRIYLGSETQMPDPAIEADKGVGNTPAYRGTAYVVFENMQLADFGNRLPNLEFFVAGDASISADVIVADVLVRCGIDLNTASTVGARADCQGFMISNESSGIGALQPLAMAYNFDVAEDQGQLVCVSKLSAPLGIMSADDYAGHDGADERPQAITWARSPETDLPKSSFIQYPDPALDLQTGAQREDRALGNAQNNLSTQLPVTMSADEAKGVAQRALWEAWLGRQTATLQTDDRWIGLRVGRRYLFETPAGFEPVKIMRKTRGVNGVIDLEVRRETGQIYRRASSGVPSTVPDNLPSAPGVTELIMLDIPLLLQSDSAKATGFYYGVVGSGDGWRGADVLRALSFADTYTQLDSFGSELTAGDADDILEDWDPLLGLWDDINTVTVTLRRPDMTLESVAEADVFAGSNAAYIGPQDGHGGEVIGFGTATFVSPGVYTLSHLLRGRACTDSAMATHATGDMFVALEIGKLKRVDFGDEDIGESRYYKAVSVLTSPADAIPVEFINTGDGLHGFCGSVFMITEDGEQMITEDGDLMVTENV